MSYELYLIVHDPDVICNIVNNKILLNELTISLYDFDKKTQSLFESLNQLIIYTFEYFEEFEDLRFFEVIFDPSKSDLVRILDDTDYAEVTIKREISFEEIKKLSLLI